MNTTFISYSSLLQIQIQSYGSLNFTDFFAKLLSQFLDFDGESIMLVFSGCEVVFVEGLEFTSKLCEVDFLLV